MITKTTISIIIVVLAVALVVGVGLVYKKKQIDKSTTPAPSESQIKSTPTKNNLPVPDAPGLSFIMGAKPFIQITCNWYIADYFNIYRATNLNGPWKKIISDYPGSARTAVDYHYPKDKNIIYYRITSVDKHGNESRPSGISSATVSGN